MLNTNLSLPTTLVISPKQREATYAIDVRNHIETKNGLQYLSWAFAYDKFRYFFPNLFVDFVYTETGDIAHNCKEGGKGAYVLTYIHDGTKRTAPIFFPVLDFKNKPVELPSAFEKNTAQFRGGTKAIAIYTGIGITMYTQETESLSEKLDAVQKINELNVRYKNLTERDFDNIDNINAALDLIDLKTYGTTLLNAVRELSKNNS